VDGEVDAPAALPAVPGEWHAAVLLTAVQAARLLPAERTEVADEVREEVVLDDALGDARLVDGAELPREF